MKYNIKEALEREPKLTFKKIVVVFSVLVLLYWSYTAIEYKGISQNGVIVAKNIIRGFLNPDLKFLFTLTSQGVPYLLLQTLCIAFLGTIIGSILAIPLAFLSSSNIVPKVISRIGALSIAAIRTFPSFVYALIFIRMTGPGPFAGVLTMSITSIGMIAKLYIEAIEDLDRGILESLDAAGCNTFEKIRYGILPQLSTDFISTSIYRVEINLKNASVLGLVGAGGIGAPLLFAMSGYKWRKAGSLLIGLIVFVLIVEYFSSKIRNKLARG